MNTTNQNPSETPIPKKTLQEILRENVRLRLAYLGKSLSQVASEVGLPRANVQVWTREDGNPTLQTLQRLADALVISKPSALLDPDFNPRDFPVPVQDEGSP